MVLENGVVDSPERVGFYSGTIQSMFAILNVVTSAFFAIISDSPLISRIVVPWTYASDRYGRKPVAMYGVVGMSIATATFGFSKTFSVMIITRCIGGAFSGTRSYVSFKFFPLVPMNLRAELQDDESNAGGTISLQRPSHISVLSFSSK